MYEFLDKCFDNAGMFVDRHWKKIILTLTSIAVIGNLFFTIVFYLAHFYSGFLLFGFFIGINLSTIYNICRNGY